MTDWRKRPRSKVDLIQQIETSIVRLLDQYDPLAPEDRKRWFLTNLILKASRSGGRVPLPKGDQDGSV